MAVIRLVQCSLAFVVVACAGVPARPSPFSDDAVEGAEPAPAPIDAQPDTAPPSVSHVVPDAPPPEPVPDHVSGWHCFQYRWERDGDWYLSDCSRWMESCEQSRYVREKVGRYVTECVPRSHAFCFRYQDPIARYDALFCSESEVNCLVRRMEARSDTRRLIFGECERLE